MECCHFEVLLFAETKERECCQGQGVINRMKLPPLSPGYPSCWSSTLAAAQAMPTTIRCCLPRTCAGRYSGCCQVTALPWSFVVGYLPRDQPCRVNTIVPRKLGGRLAGVPLPSTKILKLAGVPLPYTTILTKVLEDYRLGDL